MCISKSLLHYFELLNILKDLTANCIWVVSKHTFDKFENDCYLNLNKYSFLIKKRIS